MTNDLDRLVPDLETLLGERRRNGYRCPHPDHPGDNNGFATSVSIGADGRKRAHCHSHGCNLGKGSAFDVWMVQHGLDPMRPEDTAKALDQLADGSFQRTKTTDRVPRPLPARRVVDGLALWVDWCADQLQRSPEALDYLTTVRRLSPDVIREARLGYIPRCDREMVTTPSRSLPSLLKPNGEAYWLPAHAILMPWLDHDGKPCSALVRSIESKRFTFAGERSGLIYPWFPKIERRGIVFAEGEHDTLFLRSLGLPAYTLGSAGASWGRIGEGRKLAMSAWSPMIAAHDNDPSGEDAASRMLATFPLAKRVTPPAPKDWLDSARAGADVRAILSEALGWPKPEAEHPTPAPTPNCQGILTSCPPRATDPAWDAIADHLAPITLDPGWANEVWRWRRFYSKAASNPETAAKLTADMLRDAIAAL